VFRPANKYAVREELEIPQNACVLLFTASGIIQNEFKDYRTLRAASAMVAEQLVSSDVLLVALGQSSGPEQTGRAKVRFVPFEPNPTIVAKYYQAADLYLHAARADTFPTTILESLACGTPVVATAVGGIPEQVKSLNLPSATTQFPRHDAAEATGVLVAQGDADGMARSVVMLHDHAELYRRVADNAANDARQRFDLNRQCDAYLEWYDTILERWGTNEYKSNHPMVGVA
jgi:glycosyltransferase involved in cell wall biosynthesis